MVRQDERRPWHPYNSRRRGQTWHLWKEWLQRTLAQESWLCQCNGWGNWPSKAGKVQGRNNWETASDLILLEFRLVRATVPYFFPICLFQPLQKRQDRIRNWQKRSSLKSRAPKWSGSFSQCARAPRPTERHFQLIEALRCNHGEPSAPSGESARESSWE